MSSSIKTRKINDITVNPPRHKLLGKLKPEQIKGYDLFPEIYSNIYIVAKKKSGKTTIIYTSLKKIVGKDTKKVLFFVSTIRKDPAYLAMKETLKKKKIEYECYEDLNELKDVVDSIDKETNVEDSDEEEEEKDEEFEKVHIGMGLYMLRRKVTHEQEEDKLPTRKISPEYVFIFDDVSGQLKNKTLVSLMKKNRHFKSKIIISSQYLNDLLPEQRKQLDYMLVLKGQPDKKLEEIHKWIDTRLSFEEFKKIYEYATSRKFSFLYIDIGNDSFRVNFNEEIDYGNDSRMNKLPSKGLFIPF